MALTEILTAECSSMIAGEVQEKDDSSLHGFECFGVVKETGVDDEGLDVLQKDYFPFPLYKDPGMEFYKALGNRKIGVAQVIGLTGKAIFGFSRRLSKKKIQTNYIGEGLIQGGVILFDKNGFPKFCHKEETGDELPIEDIVATAKAMMSDSQE